MHTAIIDLTGESRVVRSKGGPFDLVTIASHHQAVSIAGILQMPDIGQEFNFPAKHDITTAVGIAVAQSYRLIGEADVPDGWNRVTEVRAALEEVQAEALRASLLTMEIVRLRRTAEGLRRSGDLEGAVRAENDAAEMATERSGIEEELRKAEKRLRDVANTPGIIVARWKAGRSGGGSLDLGAVASTGAFASENRSGFVILGGLRVVSVVFGEDFWWLLNNLRKHEKKYISEIGVVTHIIQAKDLAYTSDLSVARVAALRAELSPKGFESVERARIDAYWAFAGQFSNVGNMPRVVWKREPFCMVCSLDLPGLAEPRDRALQKVFHIHEKPVDPATYQGWRTVTAGMMHLGGVVPWRTHAAKYAQTRTMWPSRACPFCGKNDQAVTIEGWPDAEEELQKRDGVKK